jgi:MFS family permease
MDAVVPNGRAINLLERETMRRVAWRLIPLLMLGYFCNYLDRVNVGMAATTMNQQLGFSGAVFGFGAGIYFLGCCMAAIPSNLMLNTVGARRWIALILVIWGILSGLTALVWNDWSFYGIRCILGMAEAGFFPGAVLYLTWWIPSYYRGRIIAIFMSASVISAFVGPPIGGLLLLLNGALGLAGWQWLFVIEALPAVIMSVVTLRLLTDRPTDAAWLTPDQRTWLAERLASERAQQEAVRKFSLGEAFSNPKMLLLTLACFGNNVSQFALVFFLPLIVKGLNVPTNWIGIVSALPFLFAFVAMIYWGWHSDRTGERIWHVAGVFLLNAAGMAACVLIGISHPVVTMVALIIAVIGIQSAQPIFWSLPGALLTGTAAAGGIAMVNAVGLLGAWVGPWLFGLVKDATGSDNIALLCLASGAVVCAIALIAAGHDRRLEALPRPS